MSLDKIKLLEQVAAQLDGQSDIISGAVTSSRTAAIEAPGRNQTRYDSSKEEQGYLADGLNLRHSEIQSGTGMIRSESLPARPDRVVIGSLVRLQGAEEKARYFVLPYGGGEWIETDEGEITVITPESPLFRAMQGRRAGERFSFQVRGNQISYKIAEIA